jgi:hypothetical protein
LECGISDAEPWGSATTEDMRHTSSILAESPPDKRQIVSLYMGERIIVTFILEEKDIRILKTRSKGGLL